MLDLLGIHHISLCARIWERKNLIFVVNNALQPLTPVSEKSEFEDPGHREYTFRKTSSIL